jgi:hypothetical protein
MERTLADPLSGAEILEIIHRKVDEALRGQCHLNPSFAYESFEADIKVSIRLKDLGTPHQSQHHVVVGSEKPVSQDAALEEADAHIYDAPPNEVRQENEIPIPTLVTGADGQRDIKHVKYQKKAPAVRIDG